MVLRSNQFALERFKGKTTSANNWNILNAVIDSSETGTLTYGDPIEIVPGTAGKLHIKAITALTATVFGFINYSLSKDAFVAGDYVDVCFNDCIMIMEASAAINNGIELQIDPTTKKVATRVSPNTVIGLTLEKAAGDASLIPVLIKTPVVIADDTEGVTPGTVTASKAVVVDANKDISIFRNLSAVNLIAGASGTVGTARVFPATAAKGSFLIQCTDQTGDTVVTMQIGAMGQATIVHVGDPGIAAAYVVMSTAQITVAEADILDGATLTTSELNLLDLSAQTETITTGAISVVKRITNLDTTAGATLYTLAAPGASMIGQVKVIHLSVDNGDATLTLTNAQGGSAATTCTWANVGEELVLVAGNAKWNVASEGGVVLS